MNAGNPADSADAARDRPRRWGDASAAPAHRPWTHARLVALLLAAGAVAGCSGDDPAGPEGDATLDAASAADAQSADAARPGDGAGSGSGSPDAALADAELPDTPSPVDAEAGVPDGSADSGAGVDGALADAAGSDAADLGPDALDGGGADSPEPDTLALDAAAGDTTGAPDTSATCAPPTAFDYSCSASQPATCPGGSCLFGICVGPKLDQDRWKDCGDGTCGLCETPQSCPADCGVLPKLSGKKVYDNQTTLTVWVHGFTNKSPAELKKKTYGSVKSCGDLYTQMASLGVSVPCGDKAPGDKAANHYVAVEYYGANAPAWMTPKDVKEVEAWPFTAGAKGLHRYALVVAKFVRWRMKLVGATHVNLACHSMGCLISRHLIENNLENLAAEHRVVRWSTNTGVIAGARLARLYDNPTIQQGAKALGLELGDFVLMNPDHVMDVTAWWDHKLYAGNNPLFAGTLIHHTVATDPKIKQALNVQLLDLNNPGDEPNDGIMYSADQHFHSQKPAARSVTQAGVKLASTRSWAYFDHMANPESLAAAVMGAAGLYHKRKVVITLEEVELHKDLEKDNPLDFLNTGEPPAEVAVEVAVRYDVKNPTNKPVLVSEQRVAHRSAELFVMKEKATVKPGLVLFSGPVFDTQTTVSLQATLLEVDWYPRFKVAEWLLDPHQLLLAVKQDLPLKDKTYTFKSVNARAVIKVAVHQMVAP